jgi:hypothetical protein
MAKVPSFNITSLRFTKPIWAFNGNQDFVDWPVASDVREPFIQSNGATRSSVAAGKRTWSTLPMKIVCVP